MSNMVEQFTGPVNPVVPSITCSSFRHLQVAAISADACQVIADSFNDALDAYLADTFHGCDMTTATSTATTTATTTSTKTTATTTTVTTDTTTTITTATTTTVTTQTTTTETTATSTTVTTKTTTTLTLPTLPDHLTNPGGTTTAASTAAGVTTPSNAAATTTKVECVGKMLGSVVFNVVGAFLLTDEDKETMGSAALEEASKLILGSNIPTALVCQRTIFGGNRGLQDGLVVELIANTFSSDQANGKAAEAIAANIENNLFNIPVAGSPWPLSAETFVYHGQPFVTTLITTTQNTTDTDGLSQEELDAMARAESSSNRTTLIIACVAVGAVMCIIFVVIVMMEKRSSEGTKLDMYAPGMKMPGASGAMLVNGTSHYGQTNDFGDFGGVSDFLMGLGGAPPGAMGDNMSAGYVDVRPEFRANSPTPTHFFPGADAGPSIMGLGRGGLGGGGQFSQYRMPSQYNAPASRPVSGAWDHAPATRPVSGNWGANPLAGPLGMNRNQHYFPGAGGGAGGAFGMQAANMSPASATLSSPDQTAGASANLVGGGRELTWGQVPEPFIMGSVGEATVADNTGGAWSQSAPHMDNEWTVLGGNKNAAFNDFL
jgi:hypothetical protein